MDIELFRNIAAVVGCISACIALLITLFKPVRKGIANYVEKRISDSDESREKAGIINQLMKRNQKLDELLTNNAALMERIDTIEARVLENESDRLKSELFACGDRCRRKIVLHPEEFDHVKEVYRKYHDELGCNHSGTMEYEFICEYYNKQTLD